MKSSAAVLPGTVTSLNEPSMGQKKPAVGYLLLTPHEDDSGANLRLFQSDLISVSSFSIILDLSIEVMAEMQDVMFPASRQ